MLSADPVSSEPWVTAIDVARHLRVVINTLIEGLPREIELRQQQ